MVAGKIVQQTSQNESAVVFAARPGYGRTGTPLEVFVNLFKAQAASYKITIYEGVHKESGPLDFDEGDRMFYRIWDRVHLFEGVAHFATRVVAYDGAKNLFVAGSPLPQEMFEVPVEIPRRGRYRMRFKRTVQADQRITPETMSQVLNLLVQSDVKSRFTISTKRIVFPEQGRMFQPMVVEGLHLRRGFTFNMRGSATGLFLNLDTHAGILYPPDLLHDFAASYLRVNSIRYLAELDPDHPAWPFLKAALVRKKVHQVQPKERLRSINNIVPHAGLIKFEVGEREITIGDYFFEKYRIKLQYPQFPGIVTKTKEILPFELCKLLPGQAYTKRPSPDMMRGLLELAKDNPEQRLAKITHGLQDLGILDSPVVKQAQINIRNQPERILGRLLPAPDLGFGDKKIERPNKGVWNMLQKRLYNGASLSTWAVLNASGLPDRDVAHFKDKLVSAMQVVGMTITNDASYLREDNANQIRAILEGYANRNRAAQLIVAIIPHDAPAQRKAIKNFGDIIFGIATQCIKVDKQKGLRSDDQYLKNIILKINAKLGGVNMIPRSLAESRPNARNYNDGHWMFLGCDVSHPSPGVLRPSIASLVASWDKECSKYSAQLSVQNPRQEIVENLGEMLESLLRVFFESRVAEQKKYPRANIPLLPRHLVLFRDGVSDRELEHVLQEEWRVLQKTLYEVYVNQVKAPYKPLVTFVVVGKRHRIRFFPCNGAGADRSGNISAGFVIDKDIVSKSFFDYYLQSHAGLKGTSRSSHYICIQDENNFTADQLQQLSYDLCHVYQRATRAVSIPAPVYYADIACARADFHFGPEINFLDENSVSGQGQPEFDIQPWRENFRRIHDSQKTKMYFM